MDPNESTNKSPTPNPQHNNAGEQFVRAGYQVPAPARQYQYAGGVPSQQSFRPMMQQNPQPQAFNPQLHFQLPAFPGSANPIPGINPRGSTLHPVLNSSGQQPGTMPPPPRPSMQNPGFGPAGSQFGARIAALEKDAKTRGNQVEDLMADLTQTYRVIPERVALREGTRFVVSGEGLSEIILLYNTIISNLEISAPQYYVLLANLRANQKNQRAMAAHAAQGNTGTYGTAQAPGSSTQAYDGVQAMGGVAAGSNMPPFDPFQYVLCNLKYDRSYYQHALAQRNAGLTFTGEIRQKVPGQGHTQMTRQQVYAASSIYGQSNTQLTPQQVAAIQKEREILRKQAFQKEQELRKSQGIHMQQMQMKQQAMQQRQQMANLAAQQFQSALQSNGIPVKAEQMSDAQDMATAATQQQPGDTQEGNRAAEVGEDGQSIPPTDASVIDDNEVCPPPRYNGIGAHLFDLGSPSSSSADESESDNDEWVPTKRKSGRTRPKTELVAISTPTFLTRQAMEVQRKAEEQSENAAGKKTEESGLGKAGTTMDTGVVNAGMTAIEKPVKSKRVVKRKRGSDGAKEMTEMKKVETDKASEDNDEEGVEEALGGEGARKKPKTG